MPSSKDPKAKSFKYDLLAIGCGILLGAGTVLLLNWIFSDMCEAVKPAANYENADDTLPAVYFPEAQFRIELHDSSKKPDGNTTWTWSYDPDKGTHISSVTANSLEAATYSPGFPPVDAWDEATVAQVIEALNNTAISYTTSGTEYNSVKCVNARGAHREYRHRAFMTYPDSHPSDAAVKKVYDTLASGALIDIIRYCTKD